MRLPTCSGLDLIGGGHPYIPPITRWELKHPGGRRLGERPPANPRNGRRGRNRRQAGLCWLARFSPPPRMPHAKANGYLGAPRKR